MTRRRRVAGAHHPTRRAPRVRLRGRGSSRSPRGSSRVSARARRATRRRGGRRRVGVPRARVGFRPRAFFSRRPAAGRDGGAARSAIFRAHSRRRRNRFGEAGDRPRPRRGRAWNRCCRRRRRRARWSGVSSSPPRRVGSTSWTISSRGGRSWRRRGKRGWNGARRRRRRGETGTRRRFCRRFGANFGERESESESETVAAAVDFFFRAVAFAVAVDLFSRHVVRDRRAMCRRRARASVRGGPLTGSPRTPSRTP